jgi:hypothetical protein
MNDKEIKDFVRDRDKAVKDACRTGNLENFKAFYEKYKKRGVYKLPLPSDEVIEISLRKMLYHTASATDEEKAGAEKWLIEHGSSTSIF